MTRTKISVSDAFALLFNSVKGFECEFMSSSEYGEDYEDFFIIKFSSQAKDTIFVAFIKPLTPSSRNPNTEYSFQIIASQRDRILELAKKLKGNLLYIGWAQDKECMLIPASEKVEKAANQGSVFMSLEKFAEFKHDLKTGVFLRRITSDDGNYWSHVIADKNFGHYLNLIVQGKIRIKDGSSPLVADESDEGIIQFDKPSPSTKLTSTNKLSGKANPSAPKNLPGANNLILYGPPGTGKTMAAILIAQDIILGKTLNLDSEHLNFQEYPKDFFLEHGLNYYGTQFHPSFSYEDFFEGLRPVQVRGDQRSEVTYLIVPGVFKVISQLARAYLERGEYGIDLQIQFVKGDGSHNGEWLLGEHSLVGLYNLLERPGYLEYEGKKVLLTGGLNIPEEILVSNPPHSGIYQAKWFYFGENEPKNFVLFIDELNRGNPAKVFGEALSLIEDTKRYGRREQASITLPYSREAFVVPQNLHIICSMNSSDKSLTNLDQAFRRRFDFVYFPPAFEIITSETFKQTSKGRFSDELLKALRNHFEVINKALGASSVPQENHIGHSYLLKLLRNSFWEIETSKTGVKADEIVRNSLAKIWKSELHSQIREIVGEHKLQEFCDNFAAEASKVTKGNTFLISTDDIAKTLLKYLEDIQPVPANFPWKRAA